MNDERSEILNGKPSKWSKQLKKFIDEVGRRNLELYKRKKIGSVNEKSREV